MKRKFMSVLILFLALGLLFCSPQNIPPASAHSNLPQRYPWIKTYAIDYMGSGTDPSRVEEYKFEAKNYDLIYAGQVDLSQYTTDKNGNIVPGGPHPLQVIEETYHYLDIDSRTGKDYSDAVNWAARQTPPVNIENFFLHYSEPTKACFGLTCYIFPAGSRVPYSSFPTIMKDGIPDLNAEGTHLIFNPNNNDFINWKLDKLARAIGPEGQKPYIDGLKVSARTANKIPSRPNIGKDESGNYIGGHISELPETNPGGNLDQYYSGIDESWYDSWITNLFGGFKNSPKLGGSGKIQIISTLVTKDYDYANDKALYSKFYPYVWGIERSDQSYDLTFSPRNIYEMKKLGIYDISGGQGWLNRDYHYKNWGDYSPPIISFACYPNCALRHSVDNPEDPIESDPNYENGQRELERFAEANLALYYVAKDDNVLFFPMQPDRDDTFSAGGVANNQWMKAVEYNIGQPKPNQGNPLTPWNQFTTTQGDDPSTGKTTSFTVDEVTVLEDSNASSNPYNWEVKDLNPATPWQNGQWNGYLTNQGPYYRIHHSGYNSSGNYNYVIIETYYGSSPTPTVGTTFTLGKSTVGKYSMYSREYDNAIVYYKSSSWGVNNTDLSKTTHQLPKTTDNPSGVYYRLGGMNGFESNIIDTSKPLTSIDLRNGEGMILIKASSLARPILIKTSDKLNAQSGDLLTYTLTLTNGSNEVSNARIEDPIPSGTSFVSASDNGSSDGSKVIWNLGIIAASATRSINFQVRVQ